MDRADHISPLSESIIRTLAYYDLFDHPLTASEIFSFLPTNHVTQEEIDRELTMLDKQSLVFKMGAFYSLQNNPILEKRRLKGNIMAEEYLNIAVRQSKRIASFPFVRSVMISGSLSKGYADENSDIDFFVVTEPGRLWIARTLLVAYKRLFLFNSHKYFCVNYFVDEKHLEIEEKNLFTATEIATLIPLYDNGHYCELLLNNSWLYRFYPNFRMSSAVNANGTAGFAKRMAEWILNHCFPGRIDRFFMQLTRQRWKKLYGNLLPFREFGIAFKSNPNVSKNHPRNFQKQIVIRYEERIQAFRKYFPLNSLT